MKVLLINGSPNEHGCTYTALCEVAGELERNGVDTEIVYLGKDPVWGCTSCGGCRKTRKCVLDGGANALIDTIAAADGVIIGSPVYYAGPNGHLTAILDRVFAAGNRAFWGKPGAAVVSCRRGGATASFDRLNKYFTISNMPIVSSQYWNMVHGNTPDEVKQDLEGMQTMRRLGLNMAWLLKCIELGKKEGLPFPEGEERVSTNFIR